MIRAFIRHLLLVLPASLAIGHAAEQELTVLPKCTLFATEWADGGSFLIRTAHGRHQPGPDGRAIDLAHDFEQVETLPENDRTRNTITPESRKELLTRLPKLNHQRVAEEATKADSPKSVRRIKPMKAQRAKSMDELL